MRRKQPKAPHAWIKIGARVDYHARIGGPVTQAGLVVRAGPELMCGHWSVWLEGKSGSVACDALTPAAEVARGL